MTEKRAFPYIPEAHDFGMTLRDYFAAKAMVGYMNDCYDLNCEERAVMAYRQADAMMRKRDND